MEKPRDDLSARDGSARAEIGMLVLMVLSCERLMGSQAADEPIRLEASRLYDEWIRFVRSDPWFSETNGPEHLSEEGESLLARMASFVNAQVDRLNELGVAKVEVPEGDEKALEQRLFGEAVPPVERKGRRILMAIAARMGGKSR